LTRLLGAVGSVVDHDLVFVSMAEENVRDHMGRVAVDDLIEEICGVRKRIGTIPAGKHVPDDPDTLAGVFGRLEFGDEKRLHARYVRVGSIDIVAFGVLVVRTQRIAK